MNIGFKSLTVAGLRAFESWKLISSSLEEDFMTSGAVDFLTLFGGLCFKLDFNLIFSLIFKCQCEFELNWGKILISSNAY